MKIDNLLLSTFTTGSGESDDLLKLPFRSTRNNNPYIVKAISGMDATDIVANFSGFGSGETIYYDMTLLKRTLVIRLGLNPTFRNVRTHPDLRDELYRLIALDRTGKLIIFFCLGNDKIAFTSGKVTKLETNHFQKAPEAQITITCDDPLLRSHDEYQVEPSIFGRNFQVVDCRSTAPHGIMFNIEILEDSDGFQMQTPDTIFSIRRKGAGTEAGLKSGDIIKVSTEFGKRSVYLGSPSKPYISIVENIEGFKGSNWPMLYPGTNKFQVLTSARVISMKYREAFWGV